MINEIVVQGIGIIGVICFIVSFQIKSNKALYLAQMAGCGMFCIQFFLLGAYTGCLNLVITILRNILLSKADTWKYALWKGWPVLIIIACTVVTVVTWVGPLTLLPYIAMVGGTIGYYTNNAQKIRFANLVCCSPAWLIYDFVVGSIGGVLNESIVLISIFVSIYRYGWKSMNNPDFGK
jgi:hypothetical protein